VPAGQDRARFFRDVFFGAENWQERTQDGRRTETATISTDIEIGDDNLGSHELTLVFRLDRQARGRATTVLRWGPLLPVLQARDVTDWYLIIERGGIGAYRLRLTQTEPA
jgi:hypothetical protein